MDPVEVFVEVRSGVVTDIRSNGKPVKIYLLDWDADEEEMEQLTGLNSDDLAEKVDGIIETRGWTDQFVDEMDFNQLL